MKKILAIICVLVLLAVSAGCSSSKSYMSENQSASSMAASAAPAPAAMPSAARSDFGLAGGETGYVEYDMAEEAAMDDAAMEQAAVAEAPDAPASGGGQAEQVPEGRKIVRTVNMSLQTVTFDSGVAEIDSIAKSFGGYVQDSYVEGRDLYNERGARSAQFTVRIPANRLDEFVNSLGDSQFNLVNKSQNEEDISFNYYDSKARLNSLLVQEERLLAMLEKAEELKYMLQVEQELANVRYQIESYQSQLGRMDNSVNLSTVYIQLVEVVKYEPVENVPVTFPQRIQRALVNSWIGFGEGMQDFAVEIVWALPGLILFCLIVVALLLIVRAVARSSKRKKAAKNPVSPVPPIPPVPESPADEQK